MHKFAKQIMECVKTKVEAMGIDNIEGQHLEELGKWTDIIKDIACYDKDMRIIEAMEEAEDSEESMKYIEMYEDYPEMRKGYRGQPRDSRGRYMRRRSRIGYNEPMMYDERREADYMDGKMYYDGSASTDGGQMASRMQRDVREGRSGMMRRGYMEAKEMGKEKSEKMRELESYTKELAEDVTEMVQGMSPEEKALLKNKMQTLMTKIQ